MRSPGLNWYCALCRLGGSDGRRQTYSLQDPKLAAIIRGLLPPSRSQGQTNTVVNMDKFVFLRVILTYLYNLSSNYLN